MGELEGLLKVDGVGEKVVVEGAVLMVLGDQVHLRHVVDAANVGCYESCEKQQGRRLRGLHRNSANEMRF